jgi:hypothetical protein
VLAEALGLPSLGDVATSRKQLVAWAATDGDSSATLAWLLGRSPALERLAAGGAPLPMSLALDLRARATLRRQDTTVALTLWSQAITRYAVLAAPLGLVASLWPLRRDLARVAIAHRDTAMALRACLTFDAIIGFVDQAANAEKERYCTPLRGVQPERLSQ